MNLDEQRSRCLSCNSCKLCSTRKNVVYGVGCENSPILFVGEGPGEQEDIQGIPFVGPAGKLLDDMLSIIDIDRSNCYIANIVKCRPPANRDPEESEIESCMPWLKEQINAISPKIIVCLGRIAAGVLIHPNYRITKEHGKWEIKNGVYYTSIYHPSALLRDLSKRPETFRDLIEIRNKIAQICPNFYETGYMNE